jgi:predicted dehydrogenase
VVPAGPAGRGATWDLRHIAAGMAELECTPLLDGGRPLVEFYRRRGRIDLWVPMAVTVKVPYHLELATAALDAGKAVYCEWPLGNGLEEAETLAALARKQGVLAVAGLQARSAPSVAYVRDLINQGYVGEVLSTTLVGSGMGWGPTVEPYNAYLNDKKNGATMLSIALGHAVEGLCHCLGEVRELSATMTVRRQSATIGQTGESEPMIAEDQVCVTGLLEGGAALSVHYRGGTSRGTNLLWEINGTEGDLQLTSAGGQPQIFEMTVHGGNGAQSALEVLPVPDQYRWSPPQGPGPSANVAQAYARFASDYREGTHLCPTFDDAVTRHRMLNGIETAASTGQRQTLD